jgi:hypothetical protein
VPHGKHADLHRRAVTAMEDRPPRTIRVKWVPSHMKGEHVRAGIISREHREGNQEADKLTTKGLDMHKVSKELEEETTTQDELVQGLFTMLLDIMKSTHEKAPVRKKEDRHERQEAQKKIHGPKTGVHGEHCFTDKVEGAWNCTKCGRFTTAHMGWKRLLRGKCRVRAKADRAKWKASFHRRKWLQRAARKIAAGVHTAHHKPERVVDQGRAKWICTTCGVCAKRPIDMGQYCTGRPDQRSCRYWKKRRQTDQAHFRTNPP